MLLISIFGRFDSFLTSYFFSWTTGAGAETGTGTGAGAGAGVGVSCYLLISSASSDIFINFSLCSLFSYSNWRRRALVASVSEASFSIARLVTSSLIYCSAKIFSFNSISSRMRSSSYYSAWTLLLDCWATITCSSSRSLMD